VASNSRLLVVCLVLLFCAVGPGSARAHTRSQSFSTWHVAQDGDVRVSFSVAAREVTRLVASEPEQLELGALMASHLANRLAVRSGEAECTAVGVPRPLAARAGHVRVEWRFACPPGVDLEIRGDSFFDVSPSHVHFARVAVGETPALEALFTDAQRSLSVRVRSDSDTAGEADSPRGAGVTFASYVALGVEHILAGLDHVAFLLGLLLLSRRVREIAFLVTGFTLGHSLTLSLAALGVVEPDVGVIEALIGFTIALVAAEAVGVATGANRWLGALGAAALLLLAFVSYWAQSGPPVIVLVGLALFTFCYLDLVSSREAAIRFGPALTTSFGLVHGFGFASVLMEIGLPGNRLAPALFGFNVGVEIGQLAIVLLAFGAGRVASRHLQGDGLRLATEVLSAGLCGLGLFWFVARAFGG
jgi:hypothetical protein